jgi:hypothetical protein
LFLFVSDQFSVYLLVFFQEKFVPGGWEIF